MIIPTPTCLFFGVGLFVVGFHCYEADEYEGSTCEGFTSSGICRLVRDCPVAREALKHRQYHSLERCGFSGFEEIVCCPEFGVTPTKGPKTSSEEFWTDETPTKKPVTKKPTGDTTPEVRGPHQIRKCEQACEKFSKMAKISLSYHIVDGDNAIVGEFPHMAAVGYNSDQLGEFKFDCGGTLISERYVVTAAHCILNSEQNPPVLVRVGVIDIPESTNTLTPNDYNITNITIHTEYKWKEKYNDIALLKLARKVQMTNNLHPACLYTKTDDPTGLLVTGWGTTSMGGDRSNILQKAKLTAVPLQECNITFVTRTKRNIVNTQICAADNKSDACQGDSGGPLQIQTSNIYSVVGITSYGIGCGSRYPGIYTRISSYLDWIEGVVWP